MRSIESRLALSVGGYLDEIDRFNGWVPLLRHSSWLENGPEESLPSLSIAYHPCLMPRISDLASLMKWGIFIVVFPCAAASAMLALPWANLLPCSKSLSKANLPGALSPNSDYQFHLTQIAKHLGTSPSHGRVW